MEKKPIKETHLLLLFFPRSGRKKQGFEVCALGDWGHSDRPRIRWCATDWGTGGMAQKSPVPSQTNPAFSQKRLPSFVHLSEAEDTMTHLKLDGTGDWRIASVAEKNRVHSREAYNFWKKMYTHSKELYILTKETYVLYKYPVIGLQLDGAHQTGDLQVWLKKPIALSKEPHIISKKPYIFSKEF